MWPFSHSYNSPFSYLKNASIWRGRRGRRSKKQPWRKGGRRWLSGSIWKPTRGKRKSLLLAAYQWRGCPPQICDLPRMPQEPGCPLVGAGGGEPGRSPVGNVPWKPTLAEGNPHLQPKLWAPNWLANSPANADSKAGEQKHVGSQGMG